MTKQSLFDEMGEGGGGKAARAGGRVTEIAPLPSNPNLKRIKVDGKVIARLGAGEVESLKIEVGRRWTAALAARAEEAMEQTKAHRAAMTMLGKRALSRGELIDRLQRRGYSKSIAQRVADDLQENHWIDDEAYAAALAEELVNRKSASHAMIVERLTKRKIDEPLAREVAGRVLGEVDPVEAAVELARKRLAAMKGIAPERAARRIAGALARRGFDEETIHEALQRAGVIDR